MIISSQIYFIYKEILGSKGGGVGNPLGWGLKFFEIEDQFIATQYLFESSVV
jgi:hypothetical protein